MSSSSSTFPSVHAPRFKVIVVGDSGVGKTSFITRHKTGEFTKSHIATDDVIMNTLPFATSNGDVVFNTWDCSGSKGPENLDDEYHSGADAAIIMFDVTSKATYKNVSHWYMEIRKHNHNIPIVLCGSKFDRKKDLQVKTEDISFNKKGLRQYYNISAKSYINFENPFLYLTRVLTGDETLSFVESPAVLPPEVKVDSATLAKWNAKWNAENEMNMENENENEEEEE